MPNTLSETSPAVSKRPAASFARRAAFAARESRESPRIFSSTRTCSREWRAAVFIGTLALLSSLFSSAPLCAAASATKTIVFFGDSLTAGYGLDDPLAEAYPALLQEKIADAQLPYRVVNAGLSGETSAGGARRIDWILRQRIDVFVLALGANDGLRGIEPSVTRENLQAILDRVRARNPDTQLVVAGMMMPPSMGQGYAREFAAVFAEVAKQNNATFLPFLLEGVGGIDRLNQPDRIHPTAEGHRLLADTVWKTLEPLLR